MATDFDLDLVNFSTWYDEHNLVTKLKVLYQDLIAVTKIDSATKTIHLLQELRANGRLSSDNRILLDDTIKVTEQFGVIDRLKHSFLEVKEITKFTRYRLQIVAFGNGLRQADVDRIDALYNGSALKNYKDAWSMILDLEERRIICEEKIEEFINNLRQVGLESSVTLLTEGQVATRRSNEEQGMRKRFKSGTERVATCSNDEEQGMRKRFKSGQVATSSNEGQGMPKEGKSETDKIEEYLLQRQRELCSQASIFTPATMRDRYSVDISQMFTDLELRKQSKKNKDCKPTTLTEVIDVISSTPGCRALIDGEGGIGKTTILRHLSYNWATATQSIKAFEGKIVFLLSVRDLDKDVLGLIVKQIDMTEFSMHTKLPQNPELIKNFLKTHDDKIVLLLDGLDELRFNNPSVLSLFKKNNLKNSSVILTSRSENIDKFVEACDVHVRVNGFNKESIGKYIDKHFDYFEQQKLGKSLRNELDIDTYLAGKKHPEAYEMCKNPMLLCSICLLWEGSQSLPTDKAELFKEIFRNILNQFNKQEQFAKLSKFEDTPAKHVNAMILLGKCMYDSLKVNQLSINMKDLNDKHTTKDLVDMSVKLGFVYEEPPILKSNFDNIFMPPHKLIVESLVGFYLCKLCESEGTENECSDVRTLLTPLDDDEWEVIRESEHLYRAREFAIGFLGDKAGGFLKHWVTDRLSTYRNLPRNLNFVKKQHKDDMINELINHMTIKDLEINNHLDDISTSIRMFIDYISPGVQCDGHFIRLIMQLSWLERLWMNDSVDSVDAFCSEMALERKGRVIAHILGIQDKTNGVEIRNLSRDVFHDFVSECSLKQVQLALRLLSFSGNNLHNIDVNSMYSLVIMCPELVELDMSECNLSGDVINDFVSECSLKQVQLALESLYIYGNNLHNIDVNSLSSLLIMCPKLRVLDMSECNLSADIINDLGTECSLKQVQLALESLVISGNNLHNIDVNSLSSLLIMCPKLRRLGMWDCNLSADVIRHVSEECSIRNIRFLL
ncbi:uncharacterized protein [Antedon mediterranea]|uniref:uncharacterized protein n=1 Tax=Antedon mediterranea TaxID=105859 RepID=UPI003AF64E03